MSIDLEKVLNHTFQSAPSVYGADEAILYALSIGAGADPVDAAELAYVYELNGSGFKVFPTLAVTFPFTLFWQIVDVPGLSFNPMMLLHGEQFVALKRPLPPTAAFTNHARITNIYDKGSGAVVMLEVQTVDETGEEVALNRSALFIRGLGGFGGDRGHLPGRPICRPTAPRTPSRGRKQCPSKRCSTAYPPKTATRCTPIRKWPPLAGSTGPFYTACVLMDLPPAPS